MSQRVAFVFPGQGSQAVGMGADVFRSSSAAHAVYEAAGAALGLDLARICFEGPEDALKETINTQPALVTTSLALLAALQEAAGATFSGSGEPSLRAPLAPAYLAGHSIGEYAALAASGALGLGATIRLARERGRLMHEQGGAIPSGMAAVLGMDTATLEEVCHEATRQTRLEIASAHTETEHPGAGRVVVANDNAPGQVVISGSQRALETAMEMARARGARRIVSLAVSGAFHSPVMAPAAEGLARAVAAAPIQDAAIPIVSNISAAPITSGADLRDELSRQVVSPVQWTRSVRWLADQGVTTFVEIGPGQVLSGLIKRIVKEATTLSVSTADDVARVAPQIQALLAETEARAESQRQDTSQDKSAS